MAMNIMVSKKTTVQHEILKVSVTELAYYKRESVQLLKVDFSSLFSFAHQVLYHTTSLAENCLLGKNNEIIIPKSYESIPSINCALDVLKRIQCKVACGGDKDHAQVTDSIVNDIIPNYSWAEKAVMTMAAFALSYGELVFFVHRQQLNPFAKLISSLRGVDVIERVKQEQQFKRAIIELNGLTNQLLKLIKSILQLNKLSKMGSIDVTGIALDVQSYSLTAIKVAVQCMTLVHYLTCSRMKIVEDLSSTVTLVETVIKSLQESIDEYKLKIAHAEEWDAYSKLHNSIHYGAGIVQVMTHIMFPGDALLENLSNHTPVRVDELKGKNVLLFISRLDNTSEYDFSYMIEIHKMLEKDHRDYKIVWIPFLEDSIRGEQDENEDWPMGLMQEFDAWKLKMPWYVINYERSRQIIGIKYIKERWCFNYNPIVVLLNSSGQLESPDVMPMIRAWRTCAFPFNRNVVPDHGIGPIIFNFRKKEIGKEEYIFLYGGTDQTWVNNFGINVKKLESDNVLNAKISLTSMDITAEKNSTIKNIGLFWSSIESMLCVMMQWGLSIDMTKQIQKVLSFKEKRGWAMLCKGNKVLACASESIIMETVVEWKIWTKDIGGSNTFDICFINHLNKKQIGGGRLPCCHVPFQSLSGWIPVSVQCPDCEQRMERIVTYKCCHDTLYNNNNK